MLEAASVYLNGLACPLRLAIHMRFSSRLQLGLKQDGQLMADNTGHALAHLEWLTLNTSTTSPSAMSQSSTASCLDRDYCSWNQNC